MAEYISRDKAIELIQPRVKPSTVYGEGYLQAIEHASDMLTLMPAADVQPAPQWISVKERLPEIGRSILIYYPKWDGDEIQVAKLDDDMLFDICGEFDVRLGVVTHWMPLPEPPKDGDPDV